MRGRQAGRHGSIRADRRRFPLAPADYVTSYGRRARTFITAAERRTRGHTSCSHEQRDEAELRVHPGGRSRLRRPPLLRRQSELFAESRQDGSRRFALHERLRELVGLLAVSVCDRDGTLSASAARRLRRADRHRFAGVGLAAGTSDDGVTLARRGLRHRARREMAPGFAAMVQPAQERLRRVLRTSHRSSRFLHAHRLRRPHDLWEGDEEVFKRRLSDGSADRSGGRFRETPVGAKAVLALACTTTRRTGRGKRATTSASRSESAGKIAHLDGGSVKTYLEMIRDHGRRHRARSGGARRDRRAREHARRLFERQRRRALLRQLPAHGQEDGPARGRHPRAVHRSLACAGTSRRSRPTTGSPSEWIGRRPLSPPPVFRHIQTIRSTESICSARRSSAISTGEWCIATRRRFARASGSIFRSTAASSCSTCRATQRERANMRYREPKKFEELRRAYFEWDASMPPRPEDAAVALEYTADNDGKVRRLIPPKPPIARSGVHERHQTPPTLSRGARSGVEVRIRRQLLRTLSAAVDELMRQSFSLLISNQTTALNSGY